MSHLVATFFLVGHLKPAPGTWGSLAALPVALVIHWLGGPFLLVAGVVVAFVAGFWAAREETRGQEDHDPGHIVIDEVAGQWVALLPVAFGAWYVEAPITELWPGWIAAFVLFRFFDIWKPGPIGRADRRGDPAGLMLDDIWAGCLAAIGVVVLAALSHLVLLA